MSQVISVHDKFFKHAMADKRVALEFFSYHLPDVVKQYIDWQTLQLTQDSHIDSQLKASFSDLLYQVKFAGKPGYLYVLVEHQSTADKFMPLRLLKYITNILEKHAKQTKSINLPLVYPVVFYHGSKPYPYSTDIRDLINAPQGLIDAVWLKPFQLIDTHQLDNRILKNRPYAGVMEYLFKHILARDVLSFLQGVMSQLQQLDKAGETDYIISIFNYLLAAGESSQQAEVVSALAAGLSQPMGEKIMTLAERFIEQGKAEGIIQGKTEGQVDILLRQLTHKFGTVSAHYQQLIKQADAENLASWAEAVLEADSLDAIFNSSRSATH